MCAMNPRLLRPTPTGFNPRSIAGLAAWYDAAVASSITLTSGFVSQWNDLSGNNLHLTQSVEADRPGLGTINGKTAIDFDGTNDYLAKQTADVTPGTIFCVLDFDVDNVVQLPAAVVAASGVSLGFVFTNAQQFRVVSWDGSTASGSSGDGVPTIAGVTFLLSMRYQGVSRLNGSDFANSDVAVRTTQQGITVGARRTFATASPHNGRTGEVLVYNRALTASEVAKVERYLAAKWGVTLA